jgi:preprotein translocase subunit Sec63
LCLPLEHKQLLKNAQLELKKSKRKDYYKILGVDKNASEDEIKKAYRKRALMHHPGRAGGEGVQQAHHAQSRVGTWRGSSVGIREC